MKTVQQIAIGTFVIALAVSGVGVALQSPTPDVTLPAPIGPDLSPLLAFATDLGPAPLGQPIQVVMSLDLRNKADLDPFLVDASNPASPSYQQWLTQDEFNARYGPTLAQEQSVIAFLERGGFTIVDTFPNHLLVVADGTVGAANALFATSIHNFVYNGQTKYAAIVQPTYPAELQPFLVGALGLDNLGDRAPRLASAVPAFPVDNLGTNCCYFSPRDLNNLYNEGQSTHNGAGQTIVIAGAYDFKDTDLSGFDAQFGIPAPPSVTRVCVGSGSPRTCKFNTQQSIEISLDIEYSHGTAHSAALASYMAASTSFTDFTTMENRVVTDNRGHSVSESWGACESAISGSTITSEDNVFANGGAVGQSWFFASGDSGSNDCNGALGTDYPASSDKVTGVGGTHATCSGGMTPSQPVCTGWGSETAWSGSGGGSSTVHARPSWQTGCNVPAGTKRLVPDIALESDTAPGNLVEKGGSWYAVGGTSDAAPQMAGMFAALNQAKGGSGLGLANARFYAICGGNTYHDITSGSNGAYSAGTGYDMVTGLGTINEGNLLVNY